MTSVFNLIPLTRLQMRLNMLSSLAHEQKNNTANSFRNGRITPTPGMVEQWLSIFRGMSLQEKQPYRVAIGTDASSQGWEVILIINGFKAPTWSS